MKRKPNGYIIKYRVMEGNNYAGGWSDRVANVDSLDDIDGYSNITSVQCVFIEYGEVLTLEHIEQLKKEAWERLRIDCAKREVKKAKNRLKQAEEKLAIADGTKRKRKKKRKEK